MEWTSCLENQNRLRSLFCTLRTVEERYSKLIEFGRGLKDYPKEFLNEDYLVKGCQSSLYLRSTIEGKKMHFLAQSDALISAGLASLLIAIYEEESPETVIKCPPTVLKELNFASYLSPGRANGLSSLYLHMQQDAVKAMQTI